MKKNFSLLLLASLFLTSCSLLEADRPLRERLQGEWLLTKTTDTYFDSLGNQTDRRIYQHERGGRHYSIYTFQDTVVNIKSLTMASAFLYKLKEGEGAGQDSILAFSRHHPTHRYEITFPEEGRMQWRSRSFHTKGPTPHPNMEETVEFRRVKVNYVQSSPLP